MNIFGAMRLPRSVALGSGQRRALGAITARLGKKALICTDARLGVSAELAEIVADLKASGVDVCVYDQTQPDLPVESVVDCVEQVRDFGADVVLGIGGGSSMDMAKVVAVLLTHGGDFRQYYGEFNVPGPVMPLIAVPTTSGTGSEVTPVAVVSDDERGAKVGIASPHLIPIAAVCDPELTVTCPPFLTALSGADALTHAVEAFTTLKRPVDPLLTEQHVFMGKNVLSDQFARLAVLNIWKSLHKAFTDGTDIEARENLMLASLAAGCAFGAAGTAAAHALQYPVGNLTHTAHGDGVACLLPYVMQFNQPACIDQFAELGALVGVGESGMDQATLSQRFIDGVASLLASVNIPRTLKDMGLAEDKQDYVAETSLNSARLIKNNPRPLDLGAMKSITYAAYSGDRMALQSA